MKTVASLVAAFLLVVSMSAVTYACTETTDPKCSDGKSHTLSDKIFFFNDHVTDAAGSPTPKGTLGSYIGNANVLDNTTDYVNWIHEFNFSPSVQNPGGILKASLSVSLVNYLSNDKDEHGNEYGDRDHEEDRDHHDVKDDKGKVIERNKKQRDDGKGRKEDDRRECSIDISRLYTNNAPSPSASIWLEGNAPNIWFNIPTTNGDSGFMVILEKLYDGKFSVGIKSTMNDFVLEWSKLDIEYCSTAPVPEPGTMMLLGFGMLGIAIYGKRRMNRES